MHRRIFLSSYEAISSSWKHFRLLYATLDISHTEQHQHSENDAAGWPVILPATSILQQVPTV